MTQKITKMIKLDNEKSYCFTSHSFGMQRSLRTHLAKKLCVDLWWNSVRVTLWNSEQTVHKIAFLWQSSEKYFLIRTFGETENAELPVA